MPSEPRLSVRASGRWMPIKARLALSLAFIMTALVWSGLPAKSAPAGKPLSEQDVTKLLKMGASSDAVARLVEKYGISFPADDQTLGRLKEAGAQPNLLETIQRKAPAPPAADSGASPAPPPIPPEVAEAAQHLELGQAKAKSRDFVGALREFQKAEELRPEWADVYYRRGLVLADLERYSEAAAEWKKYLARAAPGTKTEGYSRQIADWEGRSQRNERARRLAEQGQEALRRLDAPGAVRSLAEAAQLVDSMGNLLSLARAYLLKGDSESLLKTAAQALALDPRSAQALLYRATAELGRGEATKSRADIEQALSLNPGLVYGYALLGASLDPANGQATAPKSEPKADGRADPNGAAAHNRTGWALWNGGQYAGALEELRRAAQLEPHRARWYTDLAYGLADRGDALGAIEAGREAARLEPNSASAHDALGTAFESRGSLDLASQEYREAARLTPPGAAFFLDHASRAARKRGSAQRGGP